MAWIVASIAVTVVVTALALLARKSPRHPSGTPISSVEGAATAYSCPTAAELTAIIQRLRSAGAQWPQILAEANPTGDPDVQQALIALRGPHQFMPHVGLNVLQDGCRRALARDPEARLLDAVHEALRSAKIVLDAGD